MHFADSFRAARLVRLVNLVLQAVLFLTLFLGLNYVALSHTWWYDLTNNNRNHVSTETRAYLEHLERDVSIVVTIPKESETEGVDQAYRDISGLLREYAYLTRNFSKKITVEYLDVYVNRKRAEELGIDQPNLVVLSTSDDHRRALTLGDFYRTKDLKREAFIGEAALTAAVLDVSNAEKKRIYFLAGHEEMRPDDVDRARGLSQLSDELRQRNFEVIAPLDLSVTHKIPDDANNGMIVIAGPRARFQPFEVELLRNYLSTRAGRVVVLLEPGRLNGLDNLFFDWGIIVSDDFVVDLDPRSLTENLDLRLWNFSRDPSHITDNLINNGLSVLVGPARSMINDVGANDDSLSVRKLISTSPTAYGEKSYRQRKFEYTPGQDLQGELGLLVVSERLKPANNLPLSVRGGRLVVMGSPDLVANGRIFTPGNLNLFLAIVNWAVDRDTQMNIPARPIQHFQLALSQEEFIRLRLGLFLVVPGAVALLGIVVYWTRRS